MSQITVYKDDSLGTTAVSNLFIDKYMIDANDAQIKVYLYLVRMMEAKLPTGISDMADKFNHTEKDICRALKHWESMGVISLEYNDAKVLTGIRFIAPSEAVSVSRPLAPIVPLKIVSDEESSFAIKDTIKESAPVPAKPTYTRDQIKEFKSNPETSQITFIAEMYLKSPLTRSDMETLYFIHYDLNFSCELIDYLLQHCIEHGKSNFTYIKKVALIWAEKGVQTPDDAKKLGFKYSKEVYTILKALGRNGYPTDAEASMVTKWYTEYALPLDVIGEACERTVIAVDSHRLEYCDKILTAWYKAKVTNLNDIAAVDASFSSSKKAPAASNSNKSGTAMIHTDYDFDEIEKLKLKESF